jgi:hypothetical protein
MMRSMGRLTGKRAVAARPGRTGHQPDLLLAAHLRIIGRWPHHVHEAVTLHQHELSLKY